MAASDLVGLSKPLAKLIEAFSAGVGTLYEPVRIRKEAEARADAEITLAKGDAEAIVIREKGEAKAQDLAYRARERVRKKELRRQANIEAVLCKAKAELAESVDENPVDPDWATEFFEQCQDISNEQMQSLWGRLLAGEVTRPGSYSLRTLAIVRTLRKQDADLFTRFCAFVWNDRQRKVPLAIVFGSSDPSFRKTGLRTEALKHLEALGLLAHSKVEDVVLSSDDAGEISYSLDYFRRLHVVRPGAMGPQIRTGQILLTESGQELAPIAGAEQNEEHRTNVVELWRAWGYGVDEHAEIPPVADPSEPE